jgi:hypothetical protein
MWYVEALFKTCSAGDWTFYDTIKQLQYMVFISKVILLNSYEKTTVPVKFEIYIPAKKMVQHYTLVKKGIVLKYSSVSWFLFSETSRYLFKRESMVVIINPFLNKARIL